jgi:hypothetical protein
MRQLVKARAASAATKELFEPFGPVVVSLGRTVDGGFIIEVCFASEPPVQALKITEVRGFPIVCVVDKSRKSC